MTAISAKVITHSIAPHGGELITIQTKAPKFLDAEIEKHRMISSNSSSDRAIPFNKMVDTDTFIPEDVRLNEKGMQGYSTLQGADLDAFIGSVQGLYDVAVEMMYEHSYVHKQHLNRYLLPFSYQDKVMTATKDQWEYFLGLRMSEYADPAIQKLAIEISLAIASSVPAELEPGQWHLPYVSDIVDLETAIKCSVARCARVSYSNHDGSNPDVEADIKLADRLLKQRHMTPFEHQATPMRTHFGLYNPLEWENGVSHMDKYENMWSGNLKGWIQNRKLIMEMIDEIG